MHEGTLATILIDGDDLSPLEPAIESARRLRMHLEAVCLSPMQFEVSPVFAPEVFVMPAMLEDGLAQVSELEQAVDARLRPEDIDWSIATLTAARGALAQQLAQRLRYADLLILPRPTAGAPDDVRLFEAALYHCRVPILLADAPVGTVRRAVIGWDGSDVALAAVRAAIPFLQGADAIDIVTVDPPRETFGHGLAQMLSRRGFSPNMAPQPRGDARISAILLEHARDIDADLLVAGAYGHSRLQQALLGGVTRDLLEHAHLPLLLAR